MSKRIPVIDKNNPEALLYAVVDDEDFPILSRHLWHSAQGRGSITHYAFSRINGGTVYMHSLILGSCNHSIDHENMIGLDNRKKNLRMATSSEQNANKAKFRSLGDKELTSSFKGVSKKGSKWVVRVAGKNVGCFSDEEDAARAYDARAVEKFGNFARLNFPDEPIQEIVPSSRYKKSVYRGVAKSNSKWSATIHKDGVRMYLGLSNSEEEAARLYDAKALELFGKSAVLNFP